MGSGEGLLWGGGGLSGSSVSSSGSSLMCTGGMDVVEGGHEMEAGSGIEIDEEEAEGGVCKADIEFVEEGVAA